MRQIANRESDLIVTPVERHVPSAKRHWLGADFWANRLQDWARSGAEIHCRAAAADLQARTAHILTRRIEEGFGSARLTMRIRNLEAGAAGLGGWLIGAGGSDLDYRSAALIQRFSGANGGLLAVVDEYGQPQFRAFDDPADQLEYARFSAADEQGGPADPAAGLELDLLLEAKGETCDLRLIARDAQTGAETGCAVLAGLAIQRVLGNIALISSPMARDKVKGARWAFSELAMGGGVRTRPERALGPVMACLYSLNRSVLKMTAQLMPLSRAELPRLRLDWRRGGQWHAGPVADHGDGHCALFRIEGWDADSEAQYRIVDPRQADRPLFEGVIHADPGQSRPLAIALHSCLIPTSRQLDDAKFAPRISQETAFGRYSSDNLLFPHAEMVARCESHSPDLYLFVGDQYYETFPTRYGRDGPDAMLDTLYRWYLFLWTWREPLRNRPSIVLADDHDILQGNVWGNAGKNSELPREEDGGYKHDKALVRTIFRIQSGHNPDPYDPRPIAYDIPVSFGSFVFGGTSFAFVEDRKFKSPPDYDADPLATRGDMLGERQEAFLAAWKHMYPGLPKICITASIWGSPQTAGDLKPLLDYDANGYPPDGRTRAVRLLRDAGAIALAGDQHLAMVAIQGVDQPDDGPLFFAGPAGAAFWQRWFEGQGKLPNRRNDDPDTGDFVDCFGNPMRVLAVANPRIGFDEFMASKDYWGNFIGDPRLKSEGFGIVKVEHDARRFVLECWPDRQRDSADRQYAGWPYVHPFA